MFERYTPSAMRVITLALEEARLLRHDYIGTEHLLLGIIHEGEGIGAEVLSALDLSLDLVRQDIEEAVGRGDEGRPLPQQIPFDEDAKNATQLSLSESAKVGTNYIGTEHLLLGIIAAGENRATRLMIRAGIDVSRIRVRVTDAMRERGIRFHDRPPPVRPTDGPVIVDLQLPDGSIATLQLPSGQSLEDRLGQALVSLIGVQLHRR